MSLYEAVKNALLAGRNNAHATLVDRFAYPLTGSGLIYERMAERIKAQGGEVRLRTPVKAVRTKERRVSGVELESGEVLPFDQVISSMPLTLLVQQLDDATPEAKSAARSLRFRSTILVYLHVDGTELFPDNWVYIHDSSMGAGRVTNFRNWVPQLYGDKKTSILALEYWCYDNEPLYTTSDDELIRLATQEIKASGLVGTPNVLGGHVVRIRRCYPVYSRGYKALLDPIVECVKSISGLSAIGRYGAFKYNNQDHSILMGLWAAENLSRGTKHDLWSVNTDYEYQEGARITDTGLEPLS